MLWDGMIKRIPQYNLIADLARMFRVLGSEQRLALLEHVAQGERNVEKLSMLIGASVANTSQHLQNLKRAGLVRSRRDGKQVYYSLTEGPLLSLLSAAKEFADHTRLEALEMLDGADRTGQFADAMSKEELLERLTDSSVVLIDVRPEDEYSMGHLPGAISAPIEELAELIESLPKNCEIVAYCRGPYCVLSNEAVTLLSAAGYRARRLAAGYPDWKIAGHPVEAGSQV